MGRERCLLTATRQASRRRSRGPVPRAAAPGGDRQVWRRRTPGATIPLRNRAPLSQDAGSSRSFGTADRGRRAFVSVRSCGRCPGVRGPRSCRLRSNWRRDRRFPTARRPHRSPSARATGHNAPASPRRSAAPAEPGHGRPDASLEPWAGSGNGCCRRSRKGSRRASRRPTPAIHRGRTTARRRH